MLVVGRHDKQWTGACSLIAPLRRRSEPTVAHHESRAGGSLGVAMAPIVTCTGLALGCWLRRDSGSCCCTSPACHPMFARSPLGAVVLAWSVTAVNLYVVAAVLGVMPASPRISSNVIHGCCGLSCASLHRLGG